MATTDIGAAAGAAVAKINKARDTAPLPATTGAVTRPALIDREADYAIPARVLSTWAPEYGPRPLRRALTVRERSAVGYRAESLRGGLRQFGAKDTNIVRAVLHGMLGGFRSLRQQDDNAEMSVNVLLCVLRDFPAWAIEEACIRIATGQTDLNERWPPSDAQIHAVVAGIAAPYRKTLAQADALLSAPVGSPTEPARPSKAEVEAKLGRTVPPPTQKTMPPDCGDGKHMQRVLEDIAARKAKQQEAAA